MANVRETSSTRQTSFVVMDVNGSVLVDRLVMIMRERLVCLFDKTTFVIQNYPYNKCPDLYNNDLL